MTKSAHIRYFTLTEATISQLTKRGFSLICHKCSELLKVGDKIVSKQKPRKSVSTTTHYHEECWDGAYV